MQKQLVLTVTGSDRVGIVDEVTSVVLQYHGNVESSRMARLGGEFAMLMLVSVATEQLSALQDGLSTLQMKGLEIVTRVTSHDVDEKLAGWPRYQIGVSGADHEGIVHEITHYLAQEGINIETMDTGTEDAPFGGTVLFIMQAEVAAPPHLTLTSVQEALADIGHQLQVETEITPLSP